MKKRKSTRKKAAAAGGRKQGTKPQAVPRVAEAHIVDGRQILTAPRLVQIVDGREVVIDDGKPTTDPQRLAFRAEWKKQREQMREAARQEYKARLGRRPVEMQRADYTLPPDIATFLRGLMGAVQFSDEEEQKGVPTNRAFMLAHETYMRGCKQGFIEGFLYGEEKARPGAIKNRERLRQQNLEKLARLGIADRNAEIVAEFHRLERTMPVMEDRYQHLADEAKAKQPQPGRENWPTSARQIANIIRESKKRGS